MLRCIAVMRLPSAALRRVWCLKHNVVTKVIASSCELFNKSSWGIWCLQAKADASMASVHDLFKHAVQPRAAHFRVYVVVRSDDSGISLDADAGSCQLRLAITTLLTIEL